MGLYGYFLIHLKKLLPGNRAKAFIVHFLISYSCKYYELEYSNIYGDIFLIEYVIYKY